MALIAVAADKGAPGVTTASVALAAVWPRPVLLAECDPAGGDLVYRLPGADGGRLDPGRGLLSLAVAARRGLVPQQVWEHTQKLHGGLDVLAGVTNAEQGAGLDPLWGSVGSALAGLPQADAIADCGRLGADGPLYELLAHATAIVLVTRASLGEMIRLRDRAAAVASAVHRRAGPGARVSVVVVAEHKRFNAALAEVAHALGRGKYPVGVIGGLAHEPRSADQLRGQWGGKLDRSLLIRTAREVAGQLAGQTSAPASHSAAPGQPAAAPPAQPRGSQPMPVQPPRAGPAQPAADGRPLAAGPESAPRPPPPAQRHPPAQQDHPASGGYPMLTPAPEPPAPGSQPAPAADAQRAPRPAGPPAPGGRGKHAGPPGVTAGKPGGR